MAPSVYSIPPFKDFLSCLIDALFEGHLAGGIDLRAQPHLWANITILLPNRRLIHRFQEVLQKKAGGPVVFLPRLFPIGEVQLEDFADLLPLRAKTDQVICDSVDELPVLSARERLIALASLVQRWSLCCSEALDLGESLTSLPPTSPAHAVLLSKELLQLMDEMEERTIDWERLQEIVPDHHAVYWSKTLAFLKIAQMAWPSYLQERNRQDPLKRRRMALRQLASELERNHFALPIIAAGSTGSLPALAELLKVIAHLPKGAVILPGLDQELDEAGWEALGICMKGQDGKDIPFQNRKSVSSSEEEGFCDPAHPQYGLKCLLNRIGIKRDAVRSLPLSPFIPHDASSLTMRERMRFVSNALRPAKTTDQWHQQGELSKDAFLSIKALRKAFRNVAVVAAQDEQEEARAAALAAREGIAHGKRVLLVTPDPNLARSIAIEMQRWNVQVDTSAGTILVSTPLGIISVLLAQFVSEPFDPILFLSFLKHPLLRLGLSEDVKEKALIFIETVLLRNTDFKPISTLYTELTKRMQKEPAPHFPFKAVLEAFASTLTSVHPTGTEEEQSLEEWSAAQTLLTALQEAFLPFNSLDQESLTPEYPLSTIARTHRVVLLNLLHREDKQPSYTQDQDLDSAAGSFVATQEKQEESGEEIGEAFDLFFSEIEELPPELLPLSLNAWPSLLRVLLCEISVRPFQPREPRFHILGPLEAQLQHPDLLILSGLNEGVWPKNPEQNSWLNRSMRAELGLDPPERRLGLGAHDFWQAMGVQNLVLTHALRRADAPSLPARWLQRFFALLPPSVTAQMKEEGNRFCRWAQSIDFPEEGSRPERAGEKSSTLKFAPARPCPRPPLSARPVALSITQIETLLRDPYAFYAKHILNLKPQRALNAGPHPGDYGRMVPMILAEFLANWKMPLSQKGSKTLLETGLKQLDCFRFFPDKSVFWKARFSRSAPWVLEHLTHPDRAQRCNTLTQETGRLIYTLPVDADSESPFPHCFTLTGPIDRIDIFSDGSIEILAYKTRTPPSEDQILNLQDVQLALGALLYQKGGLIKCPPHGPVRALTYLYLKGDSEGGMCISCQKSPQEMQELVDAAERMFLNLIRWYQKPENGYLSHAGETFLSQAQANGPYDGLARTAEWSLMN